MNSVECHLQDKVVKTYRESCNFVSTVMWSVVMKYVNSDSAVLTISSPVIYVNSTTVEWQCEFVNEKKKRGGGFRPS